MIGISNFIKSWWPTAIVLVAVLWLTLSPNPLPDSDVEFFQGADKVVHALMMGGLSAVLIIDFRRRRPRHGHVVSASEVIVAGIGLTLFAAIDEWAQGAMGLGRTSDIIDFWADIIGIGIASPLTAHLLNRYYTIRTPRR